MTPRILQISDAAQLPLDALSARIAAAAPGTLAVQLRDPALDGRALYALGRQLRERTRAAGAWLVVNDRLDLAIALDADGLHLGRRSLAPRQVRPVWSRWLSASAHAVAEAVDRSAEVDAVQLSPIFASPGKGTPLGLEALRRARDGMRSGCALIALGGIDAERAAACFQAGADAVAAIRADLTRSS